MGERRREAVIFDMDGTLCDVRGIRRLLDGPGRFAAFHAASVDCRRTRTSCRLPVMRMPRGWPC